MDSVNTLVVMGVVCVAAMIVVGWVSTRSNSTIDHLARSAERTAERNDTARDRFYQSLIEKMQVQGDTEATVKLAQLHAHESTRKMDGQMRHDHAVESIDRVAERRTNRRHTREEETLVAASALSAQDGMG